MSSRIKIISFYTVTSFLIVLFSVLIYRSFAKISSYVSINHVETAPTIVLDAGHGGEDGGACSFDGKFLEKEVNLNIALKLEKMLLASGFKVNMIRDKDISIYDENSTSIRSKKVSDLHKRLEIANQNSNNILISIHQNEFCDSKYYGAQVFYSTNNKESKKIATDIKNAFVGLLQPENTREIKPAGKNIYLLYNSNVPAIIVECGFLSNKEEAEKLATSEYQSKVAFAIYSGFLDYYNN